MNLRQRVPSKKAVQALEFMSRGMTKRQAMIKAGYSKTTAANPGNNLLKQSTILSALDRMKLTLENRGITDIYLAEKLAELAKSDNPKTFYMAYDRITKVVGIEPTTKPENTPKRQITFTEWVTDDNQPIQPQPQEGNSDDLIALDSIKLDRFNELTNESRPKEEYNQDQEVIY